MRVMVEETEKYRMWTEIISFFQKEFPEARIERQKMGSPSSGSVWLDIHWKEIHLEIVVYIQSKEIAISRIDSGTFVMPKYQADELIRQARGDVQKLEELLGLKKGTLGNNPVRIDVDKPKGLRMPSGNELGANEFWIPGGKTSGRVLEATVDQIQPGTYIVKPVFN